MTDIEYRTFVAGLRSEKTSRLVILMNADALVDLFRDAGADVFDADSRRMAIEAIAAEIDRRIPVP